MMWDGEVAAELAEQVMSPRLSDLHYRFAHFMKWVAIVCGVLVLPTFAFWFTLGEGLYISGWFLITSIYGFSLSHAQKQIAELYDAMDMMRAMAKDQEL